jgi:NF-kappa-B inhibitor-like protein 2
MDKSKEIKRLLDDKTKAKGKQNWKEIGLICNYLGDLYASVGEYEDAIEQHKEELDCSRRQNDELGVAVAYRRIGECHSELDEFAQALNFHQKYLDIVRKLNNLVEVQRAWATLGRTFFMQYSADPKKYRESLNTAEESHLKALNLTDRLRAELKERDYVEMRCRAYLNLGLIYEQKESESECSKYFNTAITYAKYVQKHTHPFLIQ